MGFFKRSSLERGFYLIFVMYASGLVQAAVAAWGAPVPTLRLDFPDAAGFFALAACIFRINILYFSH
ncbi:MAG: hypothetical protein WDZ76_05205 [Pseudohongiellaceae bacterium]